MIKTIKIDKYGKLTIPKKVREELGINKDQELILISDQEVLTIKKVGTGSTKDRFIKLVKEIEKQFKKEGISRQDVSKAVRWARG